MMNLFKKKAPVDPEALREYLARLISIRLVYTPRGRFQGFFIGRAMEEVFFKVRGR